MVGLGNDGKFNVYSRAATHFITDLSGYFAPRRGARAEVVQPFLWPGLSARPEVSAFND